MSNDYTLTTFAFAATHAEASIIREALRAIDILHGPEKDDLTADWERMAPEFRCAFANPKDGVSKNFDTFLSIFVDPCWPTFGTEFSFTENPEGSITVTGDSEQFAFEPTAKLFERAINTSFPIVITWAETCSKAIPGAFGGGSFRITKHGTTWLHTHDLLRDPETAPQKND